MSDLISATSTLGVVHSRWAQRAETHRGSVWRWEGALHPSSWELNALEEAHLLSPRKPAEESGFRTTGGGEGQPSLQGRQLVASLRMNHSRRRAALRTLAACEGSSHPWTLGATQECRLAWAAGVPDPQTQSSWTLPPWCPRCKAHTGRPLPGSTPAPVDRWCERQLGP